MPREKHGQVGDPLKIPVKDKKVNAGSGRECIFLLSSKYSVVPYIDSTPYKTRHTVVMIPLAGRGSTTAFIRDKVGLERRSEPCCLIVKSM